MSDNARDDSRDFVDMSATDFYQLAADRMKLGTAPEAIQQELAVRGLDAEEAALVVQRVAATRRQRRRVEGLQGMIVGGPIFLLGAAATVATYATADEHNGRYMIFWAAIVFGGASLLWGFIRYARP